MSRIVQVLFVVAVFTFGSAVEAQPAAPPYFVSLDLTGEDPSARYTVFPRGVDRKRSPPRAYCDRSCRLWLPPGEYRVVSRSADGSEIVEDVELDGPRRMHFRPTRWAARGIGLAAGIAGPVMIVVGFGMTACFDCSEEQREERTTQEEVGAVLLLTGIGATVAGWIVFGQAGADAQIYDAGDSGRREARKPAWSVGVVPVDGGAFAAASVTF